MTYTKEQLRRLIAAGTQHSNKTIQLAAALLEAELVVEQLAEAVLRHMEAEAPDDGWTPEYEAEYNRRGYNSLYMATLQDEDLWTMQQHLADALTANC